MKPNAWLVLILMAVLSIPAGVAAFGDNLSEPAGKAPARQWPEPSSEGEALYVEKCAMCHREQGMGTGLLARRMETALLEDRKDLTAEAVIALARTGIGNMPRISRGEVSDEQLAAIAAYLSGEQQ